MKNWLFNEFDQKGVTFQKKEDAEQYDRKQGTDLESKRALVRSLGISASHVVVELGCGTGALAIACAETGAHVFAVDVSQEMLKQCRANAQRHQVAGIATIHSGFLNYVHTGPKADFVLSQFAFHHLPDAWKGFSLVRINNFMKMGATLYLQDVVYAFEPSEMRSCLQHWIDEMPRRGYWSVEEYTRHVCEEYSTFAWIVEGLLERTGFEILEKRYGDLKVGGQYTCRKTREVCEQGDSPGAIPPVIVDPSRPEGQR